LKVLLKVNRGTFVAGLAGILISWPFSGFERTSGSGSLFEGERERAEGAE
jgi:hypothetical protein